MMKKLIEAFPEQMASALEKAQQTNIAPLSEDIEHVYVAGLGGSGIGGDYIKEIIRDECKVPYIVGKGYDIPAYVGKKTLFIASSYSGNTEETLASLKLAISKGAEVLCITTGGKMKEIAEKNGCMLLLLPKGEPVPRAYLGASLMFQISAMVKLGFVSDAIYKDARSSIDLLKFDQDEIKAKAKKTADAIYGKIPLIYTTDRMESVALRLRQQINENGKQLGWHTVIPEMNHNELVGWGLPNDNIVAVYLRNKDDYKRNAIRIDINKDIIAKKAHSIIEIYSKGSSLLQKMMYFTHFGDWVSLYLSELNGVDVVEVDVIDYLKGELSKV